MCPKTRGLKGVVIGFLMMKRVMRHRINIGMSAVLLIVSLLLTLRVYPAGTYDHRLSRQDTVEADRAIESWTRVIRRNPRSYEAHVNRGSAYFLRGYVFRGIMDWHRASELAPVFAYAFFTGEFITQSANRGRLLNYAVSIELDPDRIVSVLMMGMMYLDLGQYPKTCELYRKSANLTKNPLLKSELDYWVHQLETDLSRP